MIAPAPAHTPSIAAMIGCGQARIALTSSPVILVKFEQARRAHLDQRADDLEHVAAGAEIAAGAGDDERLHALVLRRRAKDAGDLVVALEGQRVLALRPVERERRDLAGDLEADVAALIARQRQRDGIGGGHQCVSPLTRLARRCLGLGEETHQRCRSRPAKVRRTCPPPSRRWRAPWCGTLRRPSAVRLTNCERRSIGERRRSTRPCATSRSTSPVTLPLDTIMRCDNSPSVMPFGGAVELRHQVEARQRDVEAVAQPAAHFVFDQPSRRSGAAATGAARPCDRPGARRPWSRRRAGSRIRPSRLSRTQDGGIL